MPEWKSWNRQESTREYVYLGEDKLKSNIGMRALRRGEDSYLGRSGCRCELV